VTSDPALLRDIAHRLAETANRQKVIEQVCLEQNLVWEDASRIVDEALETHALEITRHQSPLLTLLALTSFSVGIALMAWHLLGILSFFAALFDPRVPDFSRIFNIYAGVFQTLTSLPQTITLFITGIAMTVGSALGMKDVWAGIFDAWDRRNAPASQPLDGTLEHPESASSSWPVPALWMFLTLAAMLTGGIWVSQFLLMASAYQSSLPPAINDVFWGSLQRSWQLSAYVQRFPVPFALFILGLVLLAGGYYALRLYWLSIFTKDEDNPSAKER